MFKNLSRKLIIYLPLLRSFRLFVVRPSVAGHMQGEELIAQDTGITGQPILPLTQSSNSPPLQH